MFSSTKKSGLDSFIPEGSEINGNLNTTTNLRIEGKVKGKIVTTEKLLLESSAVIVGDVECKHALIEGMLEGNLYAGDVIELRNGARVTGNTVSSRIILEEDCQISGSMKLKN